MVVVMKRALSRAAAAGAAAVLAVSLTDQPASAADTWRKVDLPFLWPTARLYKMEAVASDQVWIAGRQGYICWQPVPLVPCVVHSHGNPVVRRWDGARWREYPLLGWNDQGAIWQLAAGGGETWIYGGFDWKYLAKFNGWAFEPASPPAGENVIALRGGPAGVWAVTHKSGAESLYRRANGSWTRAELPAALRYVNDVEARTPTDVWAVGQTQPGRGVGGVREVPAIAHWDGSSWTSIPAHTESGSDARLLHVAPVGPGEVWAATARSLLHWNGTSWTEIPGPPGTAGIHDLITDDAGTPWVVTQRAPTPFGLFRYADGAWEEVELAPDSVVSGLAVVPGTGAMWAFGRTGSSPAVWTDS